jgi:nucleotide-binding universal stress UspA family protein
MVQHLLIPVDGSALSERVFRFGVAMAQKLGAKVSIFYALPTSRGFAFSTLPAFVDRAAISTKRLDEIHAVIAENAEQYLEHLVSQPQPRDGLSKSVDVDWEYRESDHPHRAILAAAEQLGCDLIVMASHGRKGLEGFLLGSETQKVLTHSTLPVLVVPADSALQAP